MIAFLSGDLPPYQFVCCIAASICSAACFPSFLSSVTLLTSAIASLSPCSSFSSSPFFLASNSVSARVETLYCLATA